MLSAIYSFFSSILAFFFDKKIEKTVANIEISNKEIDDSIGSEAVLNEIEIKQEIDESIGAESVLTEMQKEIAIKKEIYEKYYDYCVYMLQKCEEEMKNGNDNAVLYDNYHFFKYEIDYLNSKR